MCLQFYQTLRRIMFHFHPNRKNRKCLLNKLKSNRGSYLRYRSRPHLKSRSNYQLKCLKKAATYVQPVINHGSKILTCFQSKERILPLTKIRATKAVNRLKTRLKPNDPARRLTQNLTQTSGLSHP